MESKINDILYKLQDCSIDVNRTIKEIDSIQYDVVPVEESKKRARKLKILINSIDDKDGKNFRLNLPGLPFWLLKSFCVPFISFITKHSGDAGKHEDQAKHEDQQKREDKVKGLKAEDIKNIKFIIDALAQMPPFEIVNVDSKGAKVHIYTK